MRLQLRSSKGAYCALFCVCILTLFGCAAARAKRTGSLLENQISEVVSLPSGNGPLSVSFANAWGVDACLTRHIPDTDLPAYLSLLKKSGVRALRERDVGERQCDGGYMHDVRAAFAAEKKAGFKVVAFAVPVTNPKVEQIGNALPEDLLAVFEGGKLLAHDFAGLVDVWEMAGEPDLGYCSDLPDRVAAYQKALYLGMRRGEEQMVGEGGKEHERPLVLMGALGLPPGPWLARAVKNGLLDYTDAYNFHFYGNEQDFSGMLTAHERVARRTLGSRLATSNSPKQGELPLWITECGIDTVKPSDLLNPERRDIQAEFTLATAERARAAERVAVFMPFILVHDQDPFAMTLSVERPLPAWNAYAQFTREHPWPNRPLANPPSNPNPVVLQWMPDNSTTHGQKVSGSYRFLERRPIRSRLRIYNFSSDVVHGSLKTSKLARFEVAVAAPGEIEIPAIGVHEISVTFSTKPGAGYAYEEWNAEFTDISGRESRLAFALETEPRAEDFSRVPLPLQPVGRGGVKHKFGKFDQPASASGVWTGLNDMLVESGDDREQSKVLRVSFKEAERDPLRARLAVARTDGLPQRGFIRLSLDRPMNRDFNFCVDLVDHQGQRFTIWENRGVSYFQRDPTEVWLNLADFHPYPWGRCSEDQSFRPENVEEIQLRFFGSAAREPREIGLSLMTVR